jgi:hypothetical protein
MENINNNKAREVNNPIIKQLIDETTAEELAKIDTEMTKNKQQTAVKLYTEEQVERAIDLAKRNVSKNRIVESLTPIELPSDEEIWKWWKTQKFQKEQGEQEYTMLYEIDLPKILKAFIEHFSKIQGGEQ